MANWDSASFGCRDSGADEDRCERLEAEKSAESWTNVSS